MNIKSIKFWKFWTITILIVFALVTGQYYFGLFEFILAYDQTYLSLVNLAIMAIAHLMIGRMHLKGNYAPADHQMVGYLGSVTTSIGLVGTLVGFMLLLWAVFGPGVALDPSNVASMTAAMANMAQGMSTALITSLTGILASIVIQFQIVILEE